MSDRCGAYAESWKELGKPEGWKGCSLPKGHSGNHSDILGLVTHQLESDEDNKNRLPILTDEQIKAIRLVNYNNWFEGFWDWNRQIATKQRDADLAILEKREAEFTNARNALALSNESNKRGREELISLKKREAEHESKIRTLSNDADKIITSKNEQIAELQDRIDQLEAGLSNANLHISELKSQIAIKN